MFVSKWIDVNKNLPEIDSNVLVMTNSGKIAISTYSINGWNKYSKSIKYWMPLPSVPNTDAYGYNFEDDFFGAVLNCAVRYACGRQTYMPSLVIDVIRPMLPILCNKTISVMERDIREAEKFGGYGNETIDKPMWMSFLAELQRVMKERGIERIC